MCTVMMDSTSAHSKSDCLRRTTKPGSGLGWRLLRVSAGVRDGARALTDRRHVRRERRTLRADNVAVFLEGLKGSKQAAWPEKPAGAMAPENTTQYLMRNVYDDMLICHSDSTSQETNVNEKSLPDRGVVTAQDADFEKFLAFQQRNFEEMVSALCW